VQYLSVSHVRVVCQNEFFLPSFKLTVFLSEQCAMSKVTTSDQRAVFWPWHRPTIVFPLIALSNTLFNVRPEIRCSGVSSQYCCYGNHTAGSKPI